MTFHSALSSGDYDKLRSARYVGEPYVLQTPGTNVLVATVDTTPDDGSASVTITAVSGSTGDVEPGMSVYIARTNDRDSAYFVGYARKAATSDTLYINQTSEALQAGDYVYVVDDYAPHARIVSIDGDNVVSVDFDVAFRRLLPRVTGLPSAVVRFGETTASVDFAITASAVDTDGGSPSVLWDVGDGSITSGTSSDASITVSFPQGFRWVSVTATDASTNTLTRRVPVWVVGEGAATRLLDHGNVTITQDAPGTARNADITLREGATVRRYETVCVAVREWFDDVESTNPVSDDNIAFIGVAVSGTDTAEVDPIVHVIAGGTLSCVDVLGRLENLRAEAFYMSREASPSAWFEVEGLTVYRALWLLLSEHSTAVTTSDVLGTITDYAYAALNTQGGNLASAAQDLSASINAVLQADADGRLSVARHGLIIDNGDDSSSDDRSSLTTVGNWTTRDATRWSITEPFVDRVGWVQASGGSYDTSNDTVTTVGSYAPGNVPAQAATNVTLDRQVLTTSASASAASAELNRRAGHYWAREKRETLLEVAHPAGYWRLTPAVDQWYTWALDEFARNDVAFTSSTRWLLTGITTTFTVPDDAGLSGVNETQATYRLETAGRVGVEAPLLTTDISAGDLDLPPLVIPAGTIAVPSLNFSLPDFDNWPEGFYNPYPVPPLPGSGGNVANPIAADGSLALWFDDDDVYVTQTGTSAAPTWTPISGNITLGATETWVDVAFDNATGTNGEYGAYLLTTDATNDTGRLFYTENVTTIPPTLRHTCNATAYRVHPAPTAGGVYVVTSDYIELPPLYDSFTYNSVDYGIYEVFSQQTITSSNEPIFTIPTDVETFVLHYIGAPNGVTQYSLTNNSNTYPTNTTAPNSAAWEKTGFDTGIRTAWNNASSPVTYPSLYIETSPGLAAGTMQVNHVFKDFYAAAYYVRPV
jgi:hypothetical protein